MAFQLGAQREPAPRRFLADRLCRKSLEPDEHSRLVGTERLRRPGVCEHRLRLERPLQEHAARSADREQPRGLLPKVHPDPGRMERTADDYPLRLGHFLHLSVGQRKICRLQRRQQAGVRIRPDGIPAAGQTQPNRLPDLPLVRRYLSRRPGLLPAWKCASTMPRARKSPIR